MNKFPRHAREVEDLRTAALEFVLPGLVPTQPVFDKSSRIWTMGSCFAQNINAALSAHGVRTLFNSVPEGTTARRCLASFSERSAAIWSPPYSRRKSSRKRGS